MKSSKSDTFVVASQYYTVILFVVSFIYFIAAMNSFIL